MILRILGADFSSANIGTLSTYVISKSIGAGISHNIPNFVDKNSNVTWTLAAEEGYLLGSYSITMNGETITPVVNDNAMTITIPNVTGNVRIVINSINENTGEEDEPIVPPVEPVYYTLTHGNDYSTEGFHDTKTRACIQPYFIKIPVGVTLTPKDEYLCAFYRKPDFSIPNMTGKGAEQINSSGNVITASWLSDSYTGQSKDEYVGIAMKKKTEAEFDFSKDSIYLSDYFTTTDDSIWVVPTNL